MSLEEKDGAQKTQDRNSTIALRPRNPFPVPQVVRPTLPPRPELPSDVGSDAFSDVTAFSTASNAPRSRRIQAKQDMARFHSRLMELPTELKLQIFGYLFGTRTVALDLHGKTLTRKNFYCLGYKQRHQDQDTTAILRTCRRIRDEGLDFLWNYTTFMIGIGSACHGWRQLKANIPLESMRHVIFNVGFTFKLSISELQDALRSFKQLKTAEVRLALSAPQDINSGSSERVVKAFIENLVVENPWKLFCVAQDWTSTAVNYWCNGTDLWEERESLQIAMESKSAGSETLETSMRLLAIAS